MNASYRSLRFDFVPYCLLIIHCTWLFLRKMAATPRFQPYSTTIPTNHQASTSAAQIRSDEALSSSSSRITPPHPLSGALKDILNTVKTFQQTLERNENEQALPKKAFEYSIKDSFSISSSSFKVCSISFKVHNF